MQSVISDYFIAPEQDISDPQSKELKEVIALDKSTLRERWNSERGREILRAWSSSGFRRETLDQYVGRFYGHTDIRGIDLSGKVLQGCDLSNVDFFAANLHGTDFTSADLTDSHISESSIKSASFDWATMKGCLLDGVDYDRSTSFRGVNLNEINFTLAAMLQEMASGQQRIADLEQNHKWFARALWLTCDYGRSVRRLMAWCAGIILVFAILYAFIPSATNGAGLQDAIYFSVVTFTTLGYGGIAPVSTLGRLLVIGEVILGYLASGLLVAILARRVIG